MYQIKTSVMKTFKWKFSVVLLLLCMIIVTCKKSSNENGGSTQQGLTDAEKTAITTTYTQISANLDAYILDSNAISKFNQYLPSIKQLPQVENAWIKDSALIVKFTNAGQIAWYITNDYLINPYGKKKTKSVSGNRIPVGSMTACLINQQYNDESRPYCQQIITDLDQEFTDNGYTTTIVNGSNVTLSFLETSFNSYGAIFYISHGFYDGTRNWVLSGEAPPTGQSPIQQLLNNLYLKWLQGYICLANCHETHGGVKVAVNYYAFSDKFVSAIYNAGSFPNSLIYLVACESFKGSTQLAQAYNSKGAAVTIGWDETNCRGQSTGKMLFDLLLGGLTVDSAFAQIPVEAKVDNCAVPAGANLTYYPPSGKDVCLVAEKNADIVITSMQDGETLTDRVQSLEGYMDSVESITHGVVMVNGVATVLQLSGSTNFSQSIVINNGPNTIKIIAYGQQSTGRTVVAVTQISVTGNFPILDIFTELRWNTNNTDIDFHMLPPGDDISALWTTDDCYYANQSTSWGGYLDVDNTWGYGPEHISVPSVTLNGDYRLFIHYFADHGGGVTQAFASVSIRDAAMQNFGPYTLQNGGDGDNAGDLWEVCKITFPGGTITPVNKYYYLGKEFKNSNLPPKINRK
jgi:uncharacterized protein YfaP (DUF2135 family)